MDRQITISENRLKIVLEVYKKGVLTFEEAKALLTVDDRPISQINPDWLRQDGGGYIRQGYVQVHGIDPIDRDISSTTISSTTFRPFADQLDLNLLDEIKKWKPTSSILTGNRYEGNDIHVSSAR